MPASSGSLSSSSGRLRTYSSYFTSTSASVPSLGALNGFAQQLRESPCQGICLPM